MYCFFAIDLPNSLAAGVATVRDRFSDTDGLRFTGSESVHVTLKFLGEVPPDRIGAVEDTVELAVEVVGVGPLDASVGGLGVLPSLGYIRVVWVGVDDDTAELTRLHEAIEHETTILGFGSEDHEFTPYVALARTDDVRGKVLVRRIVGGEPPMVGSFRMREMRLKKSGLDPDGPECETMARVSP